MDKKDVTNDFHIEFTISSQQALAAGGFSLPHPNFIKGHYSAQFTCM